MPQQIAMIGECMLELTSQQIEPVGRTLPLTMSYGGDTLNAAVYMGRLGVDVDYVTALGDDGMSIDKTGVKYRVSNVLAWVGSLAAGWVDVANPVNLIISGTEGYAYIVDGNLYFKSNNIDGADGRKPWADLPPELPHAFELFLDSLGSQEEVLLITVQEAAKCTAIMGAMYEGSRQGKWRSTAEL